MSRNGAPTHRKTSIDFFIHLNWLKSEKKKEKEKKGKKKRAESHDTLTKI